MTPLLRMVPPVPEFSVFACFKPGTISTELHFVSPHRHCSERGGPLVLPASAQRLIESDQSQQFISLCLGKVEFRGEVICLICQDLKVAGGAAFISNIGKV